MLESIITSKTRLNLIVKFFVNIANKGYLNSLANELGESTNSVRKELNNLTEAGYLSRKEDNNKVIYSANTSHPLFSTLQQIVRKHLGIEQIVEIVSRIGEIDKIVLIGDYARGIDSGTIEVLIVGKNINREYLNNIEFKIEKIINRKVNFFVSKTMLKQRALVVFEA